MCVCVCVCNSYPHQFEIDGEGEVKDRGDLMDSTIAECNEDSLISLDDDEDSSDS